ncbi:MAG: 1-pyrroline-5-carboxylate dehydrogenase [Candidatus Cloacimonetes bacterium 4572_65]|nr:MAG: 1-pyrroline-5-carboxylate dehydrogenase [Candidatus Cloacimonetes bacterium 4572_65]
MGFIPRPKNEPILAYAPGSPETIALKVELERMSNETIEIPIIIGGKEIRTGNMGQAVQPHDHKNVLANYHQAGEKEVNMAIDAALAARKKWAATPYKVRAAIFIKAAELIAGKYRAKVNAATMLNQSKNAFQSEIDSVCELVDFLRFNAKFMEDIYEAQHLESPVGMWNQLEYRGLEGFVFAVTPFNFTAIGGNLPTAPAMMGCVSLWKPASTSVFSNYIIMQIFQEAGLPDGVINFVPGRGASVGDPVMAHPELSGIHFTGSTGVFQNIWKTVGDNIQKYKTYPRIVGETGGKDFIVAHKSADVSALATASVRGAFEFQGQKCSALSRIYIPESLYPAWIKKCKADLATMKMGNVTDFSNFINAVIDEKSFDKITGEYFAHAEAADDAEIVCGGGFDKTEGYFVQPTIIKTTNPQYKSMVEEIFGPVLTVYVYADDKYEEALKLCDETSIYALTGALWAQDRYALEVGTKALVHAAGNFYINDKPTGAVVGQQPFGGSRASGTNDKAGSLWNLMRWTSVRTIKETFNPPTDYRYPFLG